MSVKAGQAQSGQREPSNSAADHLAWLLPLLERRPADVVATLSSASPTSETLLLALLRFALTSWGRYWPGLVLTWLESGWPSSGLLGVLAEMRSRSCPSRYVIALCACGGRPGPKCDLPTRRAASRLRACDLG
nr:hypothetical protein GCM10020063_040200 [Dactylosporangium thailandense]